MAEETIPAIGKSGGQLLIWDSNLFEATDVIKLDRVIGVRDTWRSNNIALNILNIYGPHDDCSKNKLVKRFNKFINSNNLTEIPLGGRCFTRVSEDGLQFSKVDRFLVSEQFILAWKNLSVVVMERTDSDHCPISLFDDIKDFCPKTIKIFDAWLDDNEVEKLIMSTWATTVPSSTLKDLILLNKLKQVKLVLKTWSNQKYSLLDLEIEANRNKAQTLEIKPESFILNDNELAEWKEARKS
ncbi:uncharacterized protein [Rutidosis leptorrhynchoides]|uniref:uncharacterized protein n=1 Tax=Rutidosis leptorrhynchoides TaxID=125765 RepID=UPI003A99D2D5